MNRFRGEWITALASAALALLLAALYTLFSQGQDARGYTVPGIVLGFVSLGLVLLAAVYSLRKRRLQESLPGRMQLWLWLHVLSSLVLIAAVLLHSGGHVDGRAGSWALLALSLALVSGVAGWWIYLRLPATVASDTGNLATRATVQELRQLEAAIKAAKLGRQESLLGQHLAALERGDSSVSTQGLSSEEWELLKRFSQWLQRRKALQDRLARQRRYQRWLRGWLWVHVPAAVLVIPLALWHGLDALAVPERLRSSPHDFASPENCLQCHPVQYQEWIGSMHAIAQASPVTDLQTRLVLAKDYADVASGQRHELLVGPLCEACHAPTGALGASPQAPLPDQRSATARTDAYTVATEHQNPMLDLSKRAPSSQFGVSCTGCHSIARLQAGQDPELPYRNAENLWWRAGRQYFGPFGRGTTQDPKAVSNGEHESSMGEHFRGSEFCASCHTVLLHDIEKGAEPVKLQNTYMEWLQPEKEATLNWSQTPEPHCLGCHGRDLEPAVNKANALHEADTPLAERTRQMAEVISSLDPPQDRHAAVQTEGVDAALPPRRRFNHAFVGVDYHLENDLPYPAGHPRAADNPAIQDRTVAQVKQLLRIAVGIRLDDNPQCEVGTLCLSVSNLATGHKFPAGFAFARESWIEVAVSPTRFGDNWRVLVGGDGPRELSPQQNLNKAEPGLRNFQAVLFDGAKETVLQNETVAVLKGATAVAAGFTDRQEPLQPGEVRPLRIGVADTNALAEASRIRVRFRFRNYPPAFLAELARRYEEKGDSINQQRALNLVNGLRIFEMAEDCWPQKDACS